MEKQIKPETEIRNLKKRIQDLELLCDMAGLPLLLIHCPELVFKKVKLTREDIKYANKAIRKYKNDPQIKLSLNTFKVKKQSKD